MQSFREMGLRPATLKSLDAMNITVPTPIQASTIPVALTGKDVIGSAQTAGGKTLSFAIPIVEGVLNSPANDAGVLGTPAATAVILVPTRELAQQVATVFRSLVAGHQGLRLAVLIGGEDIFKQLRQLKNAPRIIIGTPGRVIDHLQRGSWNPRPCKFLVLDEADRMVDMGFAPQIDEIVSRLSRERQTLMFTATLDGAIERVAKEYMRNPERVTIGKTSTPAPTIQQEIMQVSDFKKYDTLVEQLDAREGSIIVFVNTQVCADRLVDKLNDNDHKAIAIHGGLRQNKRDRVLASFRAGKSRVMVATDVAARGLDIPRIQHVINYDVPLCPEDYIHRIGRTSRAGDLGCAVCLVSPRDDRKWVVIDRFMRQAGKASTVKVHSLREPVVRSEGGVRKPYDAADRSNRRSFDRGSSFGRSSSERSSFERRSFDRPDRGSFDRGSSEAPRRRFDRADGEGRKPFGRSFDRSGGEAPRRFDRAEGEGRRPYGFSDRTPKPTDCAAGDACVTTATRKPFVFSDKPRRTSSFDSRGPRRSSSDFGRGQERRFDRGDRGSYVPRAKRDESGAQSAESRPSKNFFTGPNGSKKRFDNSSRPRPQSESFSGARDSE